ncbi:MAG: sigma-70 family RNA polymerase sigma factor [Myxococcota bacterium]
MTTPDPARELAARLNAIPKLSVEEEYETARLARAGDKRARDRLVEANARHVVAVAVQHRRYGVPVEELISEGTIGLLKAADKYDPERGLRFITYASHWIRAYVLEHIVRTAAPIGAGTGPFKTKYYFRLRRERVRLAQAGHNRDEVVSILSERFKLPPSTVSHMMSMLDARMTSMESPVGEGNRTLGDHLTAEIEPPDENAARKQLFDRLECDVERALDVLDPRELKITRERLMGDDPPSLAMMGEEAGISRERVRQLEIRAKKKLAKELAHLETV